MTAFDRFERAIPELMTELAPSHVPDYFDDLLQQTARTRQRPAWSALERWLPMDVALARPSNRSRSMDCQSRMWTTVGPSAGPLVVTSAKPGHRSRSRKSGSDRRREELSVVKGGSGACG